MRTTTGLAWVCLLSIGVAARSQDGHGPAESADVLKALVEAYKDTRIVEQIRKDNVLIRAAEAGDVEGVRKALKGARVPMPAASTRPRS